MVSTSLWETDTSSTTTPPLLVEPLLERAAREQGSGTGRTNLGYLPVKHLLCVVKRAGAVHHFAAASSATVRRASLTAALK